MWRRHDSERLLSLFAATRSKVQMVHKPTKDNTILGIVCISDPSCIDKLEVEESVCSE